ncbi:MAG: VCBS repeat-containing protein [Chitinophagaceae bacterium]|nr:VCBS repeat-containing protein [Chitinophagaceae bacterium]
MRINCVTTRPYWLCSWNPARFVLIAIIFLAPFFVSGQPIIQSFSPESGPIGTSVTITGNNFSATLANNIVFFGSVKATVTTASSTSLTVTVPAGISSLPISVTTGGLTAYSSKPFHVSFAGASALAGYSFEQRIDYATGPSPRSVLVMDLDNDGKPELAAVSNGNVPASSITIWRNASNIGNLVLGPRVDVPIGDFGTGLASADFDGDGKPDLAASYINNSGNISIFKNNSTPGVLTFGAPLTYASGSSPYTLLARDIDGDGRPDLVLSNFTNNTVSILRNTSSVGNISFAAKVEFITNLAPYSVAAGDVDNDGKVDLAVTNQLSNNLSVFRNTSTPGTISFATKVDFATGNNPHDLAIGDLDGDGKQEISFVNYSNQNVSVLRNTSAAAGSISFAARVNFGVSGFTEGPLSVVLGDLDGDAKPDLAVTGPSSYISVLKNSSTTGTIALGGSVALFASSPYRVALGDLDMDGKQDIVVTNSASNSLSVLRNKVNEPHIISLNPTAAASGATVTITGVNFTGATFVSFGGITAASFTVVNSTTITAVVGTGASGDVIVRNTYGEGKLSGFTFNSPPTVSSFTPTFSGMAGVITITGKYFTGTTAVSFGGTPAASFIINSDVSITATVASGSSGNVSVTNAFGTGTLAGYTYYPPPTISSFTPSNGGIGTSVSITGTNFIAVSTVSIGGVAVSSFTVNSGTSITAIVAEGASGSVAVTTPGGIAISTSAFDFPPPTITSFTPDSGPAGTSITITGTNFRSDPSGNIVFFGAVRGTVVASTTTSLTMVVPGGTTMKPVSVTVNNHTTYSSRPFKLSFPDGGAGITTSSFKWKGAFDTHEDPRSVFLADLDGDGKSDIITGNYFSGSISTLRNTSANSNVSFAPVAPVISGLGTNALLIVAVGDVNSDGKPDIVMGNWGDVVSVFRNTSTVGAISFAPRVDFPSTYGTRGITIGDFNGDAKPDLALTNMDFLGLNPVISVYKNTGQDGSIAFAPSVNFTAPNIAFDLHNADLDNDGKVDLAANIPASNGVLVWKNTSTLSDMIFTIQPVLTTPVTTQSISLADIDGDNKPDVTASTATTFSVIRNTSTTGNISFAPKVDFDAESTSLHLTAGQLDGDGKPDILIMNSEKQVFINRNTSTPGTVSFAARVIFTTQVTYNWLYTSAIGDLEGDGKPDLAVANGADNKISIFRSQVGEQVLNVCQGSNTSISSATGTTYKWQVNTGNGFVDVVNNTNYSGAGTMTLQISGTPISWNGYQYRNIVDGGAGAVTNLVVNPIVTPRGTASSPAAVCANDIFRVTFTETNPVPFNSTVEIWESIDGGPYAARFSFNYLGIPTIFQLQYSTGSTRKYFFKVTPPVAVPCGVSTNTDTTTTIIGQLAIPVITSNNNNLTVSNPDPSATYTWQLQDATNTWNNVVPVAVGTTYAATVSGKYRVRGIEGTCVENSNEITLVITAIDPVAASSIGIAAYPNPATDKLIIDTLRLADQWQSIRIVSGDGSLVMGNYSVRNQTRVTINITRLRPGTYVAVLTRKLGAPAVIRFIKL